MSETIIYNKLKNNFSQISNFALLDVNLSAKAYKLYAYMCYRIGISEQWQFNKSEILKHFKEGESAMRSAFHELIKAGFLERKRVRNDKGIFIRTDFTIYAEPINSGFNPQVENPHVDNPRVENSHEENPRVENQHHNNIDITNKDKINKDLSLSKKSKFRTLKECIAHAEKEKYLINVEEFHKYYYGDPEDLPKMGMAKLMMSWAKKPENQIKQSVISKTEITPEKKLWYKKIEAAKAVLTKLEEFDRSVGKLIEEDGVFVLHPVENFDCQKWSKVLEDINVKIKIKL